MKPAPALEALGFLAGEWEMELSNAAFLSQGEIVKAGATFEFVEDGRFLALRQGDSATWLIGRDDAAESYTILYSDARGVSRVYAMSFVPAGWKIWRDDPEFSQRFDAVIAADGETINGSWRKRQRDRPWEHDFDVAYRRASSNP